MLCVGHRIGAGNDALELGGKTDCTGVPRAIDLGDDLDATLAGISHKVQHVCLRVHLVCREGAMLRLRVPRMV